MKQEFYNSWLSKCEVNSTPSIRKSKRRLLGGDHLHRKDWLSRRWDKWIICPWWLMKRYEEAISLSQCSERQQLMWTSMVGKMDFEKWISSLVLIRGTRSRDRHDLHVSITGYLVPRGWRVVVYLRAIHVDPENYSKPEEFNPSRWEVSNPSEKLLNQSWTYCTNVHSILNILILPI